MNLFITCEVDVNGLPQPFTRIVCSLLLLAILLFIYKRRYKNIKDLFSKQNLKEVLVGIVAFGIMISVIFGIGYLSNYFNRDKIASFEKHKKFTIGVVISHRFRSGYKSSSYEEYSYTFRAGPKTFAGEFHATAADPRFLGAKFNVAYDSTNPDWHDILVYPVDFKEYHIPFPDSLKWDIPYW